MDIDRFKSLVQAYGADSARWPAAERAAALAFIDTSSDARAMLHDAAALDRVLDELDTLPAHRALEDRILSAFEQRRSRGRARWLAAFPENWMPGAAIACSLVLGLFAGGVLPDLIGLGEAEADSALIALGFDADPLSEAGDGI